MTENTKTAMIAINKWFYYAMNYPVVEIEVGDHNGVRKEYLPDFFNAFPLWVRGHLAGKWNAYYEDYGSRAVLMVFYGELDWTRYRRHQGRRSGPRRCPWAGWRFRAGWAASGRSRRRRCRW